MTTSGMSYKDRNGLQDEIKKPYNYGNVSDKLPPGLVSSKKGGSDLPNVLLCFKSSKPACDKKNQKSSDNADDKGKNKNRKRAKSRELRGGILYNGCECERRNGLQDQCPRTDCQGAPECMTKPPTCPPSEFAQGKHIIKYFDQLQKEREEFAKKMKGESGGENVVGKEDKSDFDCFPLDQLIKEGMPCPICDRPIEGASEKLGGKPKPKEVAAILVAADCLCCGGAS